MEINSHPPLPHAYFCHSVYAQELFSIYIHRHKRILERFVRKCRKLLEELSSFKAFYCGRRCDES